MIVNRIELPKEGEAIVTQILQSREMQAFEKKRSITETQHRGKEHQRRR